MARKELTIEEARQLAENLEAWGEAIAEDHKLANRFYDAGPSRVVEMWETGRNEKGKALTKFEVQALGERWCELFGTLPPSSGDTTTPPPTPSPPVPAHDEMLRMAQVTKLAGLSPSTIKRRVIDGSFPRPRRISVRRIGWRAREVKAWLDAREAS